jgi:hypothetical protein
MVARWTIAAMLGCAACTVTHRFEIPTPVVEPAPPRRIAATVGVRYDPGLADRAEMREIPASFSTVGQRWVLPVGGSVVAMCEGLAPALFARVVPLAGADAPPAGTDAVLDVRLENFEGSWPVGFATDPCRAHVVLSFAFTSPGGEEIARFAIDEAAEQPPGFSGCMGEAVALAPQQAGRSLSRDLLASAAVSAWMERRGLALEARPSPPEQAGSEPADAPRPILPHGPLPPRTSAFRTGIGWGVPRGTPGALEDPSGGLVLDIGGTYRPLRTSGILGIDFDAIFSYAHFSSTTAPPPGLFQTKDARMSSETMNMTVGLRAIAPFGAVEPWAGAGVGLLVSPLSLGGTTVGFPGSIDELKAAPSAYLATGLDARASGRVLPGIQCRWTFAQMGFGELSAGRSGDVGGPACLGALSFMWPGEP